MPQITIVTERDQIASIAARWLHQYPEATKRNTKLASGRSTQEIYTALLALDVETATPEDVTAILGNGSGIGQRCDNCGIPTKVAVLFDNGEYGGEVSVCPTCIHSASAQVREVTG